MALNGVKAELPTWGTWVPSLIRELDPTGAKQGPVPLDKYLKERKRMRNLGLFFNRRDRFVRC